MAAVFPVHYAGTAAASIIFNPKASAPGKYVNLPLISIAISPLNPNVAISHHGDQVEHPLSPTQQYSKPVR